LATYEYRCGGCGPFELDRPMGTAPPRMACPTCATDAARVFSAPLLARTPKALGNALTREERSAYEPEVVTRVPPK